MVVAADPSRLGRSEAETLQADEAWEARLS